MEKTHGSSIRKHNKKAPWKATRGNAQGITIKTNHEEAMQEIKKEHKFSTRRKIHKKNEQVSNSRNHSKKQCKEAAQWGYTKGQRKEAP